MSSLLSSIAKVPFVLILASFAQAKSPWSANGKFGVESKNGKVGAEIGLITEYALSDYLHWRTDYNLGFPDLKEMSHITFGIPTNLLYSPFGREGKIRPYLGPGIGWLLDSRAGNYFSVNALGGVEVKMNKTVFGIETRYTIDHTDEAWDAGEWDFAVTGKWFMNF